MEGVKGISILSQTLLQQGSIEAFVLRYLAVPKDYLFETRWPSITQSCKPTIASQSLLLTWDLTTDVWWNLEFLQQIVALKNAGYTTEIFRLFMFLSESHNNATDGTHQIAYRELHLVSTTYNEYCTIFNGYWKATFSLRSTQLRTISVRRP